MNQVSSHKASDEKFCKECGSIVKAYAELCPNCGVRRLGAPNASSHVTPDGKSKIAAALLAFFLGGIGVHKFYLGNIGQGILYLLFCWTLIPGIIAFIEFIILLSMSEHDFVKKYGYT